MYYFIDNIYSLHIMNECIYVVSKVQYIRSMKRYLYYRRECQKQVNNVIQILKGMV